MYSEVRSRHTNIMQMARGAKSAVSCVFAANDTANADAPRLNNISQNRAGKSARFLKRRIVKNGGEGGIILRLFSQLSCFLSLHS